ncbi:MAG TPA: glycosyltransferase [Actinocrinis sp.]|nr:glycosyltransferase [Actinocrinis sp.]
MRILFTTAPLHGHYFPLVPLASAFRAQGHEVLVATSDHFVQTAARSGLPAAACGPGIGVHDLADRDANAGAATADAATAGAPNQGSPTPGSSTHDARYAHGLVFARMAQRNLPGTLAIVRAWRPDAVVSERAEVAGPIAAAAYGIPHAELRWGVPDLAEYRAAAETVLRPQLDGFGFDAIPEPGAIADPWPPSLRLPHAADHLALRHVPYDGVAEVSPWMLTPRPAHAATASTIRARNRICVTFGTVLPHLSAHGLTGFISELLHRLAKLDCELVLAADDDVAAKLRPFPSAVRHAGRVPLAVTLGSCRALIHHGGQGTSLTALALGLPQVALPRFDDQLENADAVHRCGAGLALPLDEATPLRVLRASEQVLEDPRFASNARAVAAEIAAQPAPADVARTLEAVLSRGRRPVPSRHRPTGLRRPLAPSSA